MKKIEIIFLLMLSNVIFANKIDDLKTSKDIENFVKEVEPRFAKEKFKDWDYGNFRIVSTDSVYEGLKCNEHFSKSEIKNWQKVDINNDGLTDLLFIPHFYGYSQYVIIDSGNIIDFNIWKNVT